MLVYVRACVRANATHERRSLLKGRLAVEAEVTLQGLGGDVLAVRAPFLHHSRGAGGWGAEEGRRHG